MDFKKAMLIIILLLAILTVGAVNASDNITADELTVSDKISTLEDEIIPTEDDLGTSSASELISYEENNNGSYDDVISSDNVEDNLKISPGDFEVSYKENSTSEYLIFFKASSNCQGNYYISVDGGGYRDVTEYVNDVGVSLNHVNIFYEGTFDIVAKFVSTNNEELTLAHFNLTFKYIRPDFVYWPSSMEVGEKAALVISGPIDTEGTVYLYYAFYDEQNGYYDYNTEDRIAAVYFKGNSVSVSLESLPVGNHKIFLRYDYGDYSYNDMEPREITVYAKNSQNASNISSGISASSITVGENVSVYLTANQTVANVSFYIDGKLKKTVNLSDGTIQETFSGLSVGTHSVTVMCNNSGNITFSKSYLVVVKDKSSSSDEKVTPTPVKKTVIKLSVNKVKIKKSAKKAVIKATLKINGKIVKGKTITLKFNGKKYKAITNKKGVAKFIIKKKVLKKLKKGKKITYKVIYGKTTAKQKVKVKK